MEEGHSRIGCEVLDKDSLDWVVFQSPLTKWDKFSRPNSDSIKKVTLLAGSSAKEKRVGNLIFLDSRKTKRQPNLHAETPETGDGLRIEILNKKANSPLTLTLHFTSWSCDTKLRILSSDGATELVPAHIYKHDSENSSFGSEIKLTDAQLRGHSSFVLELTATDVKPDSGLSLNALILK